MSYYKKNPWKKREREYKTIFRKFHLPSPHHSSNSQQTPRPLSKAILNLLAHTHIVANWQDDYKCMSNLVLAVNL